MNYLHYMDHTLQMRRLPLKVKPTLPYFEFQQSQRPQHLGVFPHVGLSIGCAHDDNPVFGIR